MQQLPLFKELDNALLDSDGIAHRFLILVVKLVSVTKRLIIGR